MKIPARITEKYLLKLVEEGDPWILVDYVGKNLADTDYYSEDPIKSRAVLAQLPRGLQMMWHISGICFEVPNGGFGQFFQNSSSEYAVDTLEALEAIGDTARADLLRTAMQIMEQEVGRPFDFRERWFGDWVSDDSEMYSLNQKYWKLDKGGVHLDRLLRAFIRQHSEQFVHP